MSYLRQLFELYANQNRRPSYSSLYDYNYQQNYSQLSQYLPNVAPRVAPNIAPNVAPNVAPSVAPNVAPSVGSIVTQLIIQSLSNVMQNAVRDLSNEIERQVNQQVQGHDQHQNPLTHTFQFVILPYKNMPNKKDHTSCPICFDDYTPESMVLSTECLHFFHEDCLKKWVMTDVNQSCPICRTRL